MSTFTQMLIGNTLSIHAPREGGDHPHQPLCRLYRISIHAPRGGSDSKNTQIDLHIFENNAAKFV